MAPVVQVNVGFTTWRGRPLDGFGVLVPFVEHEPWLGALFLSSIFPGRAPEGGALLTFPLGGIRNPSPLALDDAAVAELIRGLLRTRFACTDAPDLLLVSRFNRAIPQYGPGTEARLQAVAAWEQSAPGAFLGGNALGWHRHGRPHPSGIPTGRARPGLNLERNCSGSLRLLLECNQRNEDFTTEDTEGIRGRDTENTLVSTPPTFSSPLSISFCSSVSPW